MTARLTDEQLAELERLEKEATPPPWRTESDGHFWLISEGEEPSPAQDDYLGIVASKIVGEKANADIIAAARNVLPALLDEVRRLRDAVETAVRCNDRDAHPCPTCSAKLRAALED